MTIDLGGSATTTKHWVGASQAVAQVTTWTFGGTWESSDLITVGMLTDEIVLQCNRSAAAGNDELTLQFAATD